MVSQQLKNKKLKPLECPAVTGGIVFFVILFFRKWLYLEISQKRGYTWIGYTTDFFKLMATPNLAIPQKSGYTLLGYTLLTDILLLFPHQNWQHILIEV